MSQSFTGYLHVLQCARCNMYFGITLRFEKDRANDHGDFYCPSGHVNVYYSKSEAEKLKAEAESLQIRLNKETDIKEKAQLCCDSTEESLSAIKGVVTKLRNKLGLKN